MQGPRGVVEATIKFDAHLVPSYEPRVRSQFGTLQSRPKYDLLLLPNSVQLKSSTATYKPNPFELFGGNPSMYVMPELASREEFEALEVEPAMIKVNTFQEEQILLITSKRGERN